MKLFLAIIDVAFAVAEGVSNLLDRQKKRPSGLSLRDLVALKRQDDELARRTSAKTVVIPAPSERERTQRR